MNEEAIRQMEASLAALEKNIAAMEKNIADAQREAAAMRQILNNTTGSRTAMDKALDDMLAQVEKGRQARDGTSHLGDR
ncbi:uncharacterized protein FIESC28_06764 [Fusarium coffeatum]|uniref:Uncharacterized protein n=1 Tax=Fusarium coffeatum TaxID=231269 RepID=A0A366RI96_9HYPO|nr:uncharacterized protein FIESC28_06764 [Fusarium coffeatum]RBR16849.1 hypothetical protein FIESC28_06764 [Fusarium coffeatum]